MSESPAMSRDDLFLLLQSYESSVQLNTTLLNQHQKLLDDHKNLLSDATILLQKTTEIIGILNSLCLKQKDSEDVLDIIKSRSTELLEVLEKAKNFDKKIDEHNIDSIKNHNAIKIRFVLIGSSITSVIIGLITIIVQLISNFEIVRKIAKILGVE